MTTRRLDPPSTPRGAPILALSLGFLISAALVYGFLSCQRPAFEGELERVRAERSAAEFELALARRTVRDLPGSRVLSRTLKSDLDDFRIRFPPQPNLASMLGDVDQTASVSNTLPGSVQPTAGPSLLKGVSRLDLALDISGDFQGLLSFLSALEGSRRFYDYSAPDISRGEGGQLGARMTVSGYSVSYTPATLPHDPGDPGPDLIETLREAP